MSTSEESRSQPAAEAIDTGVSDMNNSHPILARLDLIAIMISVVGLCLAGVAGSVLAIVELAKLVRTFWTDPVERWLIVIFAAALIWVTVRWKKSRI